jgi:hypothetical protein
MNNYIPTRTSCKPVVWVLLLLLFPLFSFAQTFIASSSSMTDPDSDAGPATDNIAVPTGVMQAGDLIVIYAHYRGAVTALTLTAMGGQTWTNETTDVGFTNQTSRIFWCRYNGTWTGGATTAVTAGGTSSGAITATMYVYRPVNSSNYWGLHQITILANSSTTTNTISGIATTVPNTVTMAFWANTSTTATVWTNFSGANWSKTGLSQQYRNTSGTDQSYTAAYNIQETAGTLSAVSHNQASGTSTRRTVITWYEMAAPANDFCANATPITSSTTTCNNTAGTLNLATTFTATPNACGSNNDVWYSFVAQSSNPIITISGALLNARAQLLSGTCTGGFNTVGGCPASATTAASGLTVGNTYYVRVYSTSNDADDFNICILDRPSNDDCTGAIALPVNSTCAKTMGTLAGATTSGLTSTCTGTVGPDVWYQFVATSNNTTITLDNFGANFSGTRRIQLYRGTCGSLINVNCITNTTAPLSMVSATLIPGTTYYVRVFSSSATTPVTDAGFSICISTPPSAQRSGNSYVNITKKTTGGVVEPGDTLEIRMTINHTAGTMYNMRYLDNIPTNTVLLTGTNDRISIISNEGAVIRSYTTAPGDDAATYFPGPQPSGFYNIRMNLGFTTLSGTPPPAAIPPANSNSTTEFASASGTAVAASHIPKGGGGMLFATSFRVRVTGNVGDVITLGAGKFIYRTATGGPDFTLDAIPYQILITQPMDLCANATGVNMSQESGGTFGSGSTINRPTNLEFPIPGYAFANVSAVQAVGDGQYAIVNNMSPIGGTNRNADRNPTAGTPLPSTTSSTNRMYEHWDIDGDHTGTNNNIGNEPAASGNPGGYMLMVNADFVASETYRQTLNNLCPNTYYEFSAWFRNICPTCGIDYRTGGNYTPRTPGVLPNLTFSLDGLDRYNTGEIAYENVNSYSGGWVKKGFVFITGPNQTSATLSIRNNSQGGGGNDWAMDDVTVATCLPNMTYTPTLNPSVCEFNPITINNTMRSYFGNYNYYKWQRSTDNGTTWNDIPGQSGSETPVLVSGQYEYFTSYTIPTSNTTAANNGDRYRQIVATSAANLNSSTCQSTDGVSIISLNVLQNCVTLKTDLLSFNGRLLNNQAQLTWTTTKEQGQFRFIVERSTDGIHFSRIGTLSGHNMPRAETNNYSFTDSAALSTLAYYRIAMVDMGQSTKYSRTIQLGKKTEAFVVNVATNPFDKHLAFNVTIGEDAKVEVLLVNATGNVVSRKSYTAYSGLNNYSIQNTGALTAGMYMLQVQYKDQIINNKLIKK